MILRELVVIEVIRFGIVRTPYIDNAGGRIVQIRGVWIAAEDRNFIERSENAAREKLVFVRAARMR